MSLLAVLDDKPTPHKTLSSGFTLFELLTTVGITLLILATALPIFGGLQISSQLNETTTLITQTLRNTRELAISRKNDSSFGVYFEINAGSNDRVISYQGSDYANRDPAFDQIYILDVTLTLGTTLTNNEMNFSKSLGDPNQIGTITLAHSTNGSKTIEINEYGRIAEL